jgi:hypothetical protein
MQNSCDIRSINRFIFHLSTHLFIYQTCFQCIIFMCKMCESMNEKLYMIFIINLSYVKFVKIWTLGFYVQLMKCVGWSS